MFDRFKNILVCLKHIRLDHPALLCGSALALHNQAAFEVASVVEEQPKLLESLFPVFREVEDLLARERENDLESVLGVLKGQGIDARAKVLRGRPYVEIIREVLRGRHDLVVVTAHADARDGRAFFGTTAVHLVRNCPCPVWVLHPRGSPGVRRILAAVDTLEGGEERGALNESVLRAAASLARREKAELHVLSAWTLYGGDVLRSRMHQEQVDALEEKIREEARKGLDGLLRVARLELNEDRAVVLEGDPGEVIPRFVREKSIDLLVLGTVARRGIPGLLIGNTAETVLRVVECSLLAVKPPGFVSPVELG